MDEDRHEELGEPLKSLQSTFPNRTKYKPASGQLRKLLSASVGPVAKGGGFSSVAQFPSDVDILKMIDEEMRAEDNVVPLPVGWA